MTGARARNHADGRVRDLAAIHASAKKLGMERPVYEAMLMRVIGVRSCADLDATGRARVLAELRRLGAPRKPAVGRPSRADGEPMLRKIEALLREIDAPWSYADAIAKRMFGVPFIAWVHRSEQLRAIIAALDARRLKLAELRRNGAAS